MLIFFDCEFTELGIDPKLISIGLISEDGAHEFYAELSGTYQLSDCSAFVHEAVLPHLQGGDALMSMGELTLCLADWIDRFQQPVQLATDSLSWDWPWVQEIFHYAEKWPAKLANQPASLYKLVALFDREVENAFHNQPNLRRHHALDDAKANRLAWLSC